MISEHAAHCLIQLAADGIRRSPDTFHEVVEQFATPIYATDTHGTLTQFNRACIRLAGRTPQRGTDKWCVTWKIYTTEGEHVPHEACPMAVAIRERRAIRGIEAVAERPDGTRVNIKPFPTPVFHDDGRFAGALNLLVDITDQRRLEASTDPGTSASPANLRIAHMETLARMAAQIAGRDPDNHTTLKYGDLVVFDDLMWRYPDFLMRAEEAYRLLEAGHLPQ